MNIIRIKNPLTIIALNPDINGAIEVHHSQHFYNGVFYNCLEKDCPFCKIYNADPTNHKEYRANTQYFISAYDLEQKEECVLTAGQRMFKKILELDAVDKEIVIIREVGSYNFPEFTVKSRRKIKNVPKSTNDLSKISLRQKEIPYAKLAYTLFSL